MPLYEYRCARCSKTSEEFRKVEQRDAELKCKGCGALTKRIISRTSFALKGGGWYADSYSNDKK